MGKQNLPPVKVAILIDGGFFIKRFNALYNQDKTMTGAEIANYMYTMAHKHVGSNNTLYRIFYYDCHPISKKYIIQSQNDLLISVKLLNTNSGKT